MSCRVPSVPELSSLPCHFSGQPSFLEYSQASRVISGRSSLLDVLFISYRKSLSLCHSNTQAVATVGFTQGHPQLWQIRGPPGVHFGKHEQVAPCVYGMQVAPTPVGSAGVADGETAECCNGE